MKKQYYLVIASTLVAVGGGYFWHARHITRDPKMAALQAQAREFYTDFDTSMQTDLFAELLHSQPGASQLLSFFKNLYTSHNFKKITLSNTPTIPHIIHHIWMGSPMRTQDIPLYQSWHTHHPDWVFLFWTDNEANFDKGDVIVRSFEELDQLLAHNNGKPLRVVVDIRELKFDNRVYFDEAINYGERGDILDYEIVYRYGGTYVDCDFECYRPLDLFHQAYDFFTGIQPLDTGRVQLGAALFGAFPHHPVLKSCVDNIQHNRHIPQIIVKTGPIFFTREFYRTAGKNGLKDIAFPASYFYPMGYEDKQKPKTEWCKNESYATHHWAGSWLQPSGFVQQKV